MHVISGGSGILIKLRASDVESVANSLPTSSDSLKAVGVQCDDRRNEHSLSVSRGANVAVGGTDG